jgi:hypothetical protein
MSKNSFLGISLCLLLFSGRESFCGEEEFFGPWSVSKDAPIVMSGKSTGGQFSDRGIFYGTLGQDYCAMLLRFYQNYLSVVTLSRCPMIPSCSRYSIEAIRKDGSFMGILLTADRLLHEGDERKYAKEIWKDGKLRYIDPVEHNDFWWH